MLERIVPDRSRPATRVREMRQFAEPRMLYAVARRRATIFRRDFFHHGPEARALSSTAAPLRVFGKSRTCRRTRMALRDGFRRIARPATDWTGTRNHVRSEIPQERLVHMAREASINEAAARERRNERQAALSEPNFPCRNIVQPTKQCRNINPARQPLSSKSERQAGLCVRSGRQARSATTFVQK